METWNFDIRAIITDIINSIGAGVSLMNRVTVRVTDSFSFTLSEMFVTALALALLICHLLPDKTFEDDVTDDDWSD